MPTLKQLFGEMRGNMLWDVTKFILGLSLYKAAAVLNGRSPFVALVLGFGIAFVLIEFVHAAVQRHSQSNFGAPLAGTPFVDAWLYARLEEIYRRTYQSEDVLLDGRHFIDCTFGKDVNFSFDGTAPFKLNGCALGKGFTLLFKTRNKAIEAAIDLLRITNNLRPGSTITTIPPNQ